MHPAIIGLIVGFVVVGLYLGFLGWLVNRLDSRGWSKMSRDIVTGILGLPYLWPQLLGEGLGWLGKLVTETASGARQRRKLEDSFRRIFLTNPPKTTEERMALQELVDAKLTQLAEAHEKLKAIVDKNPTLRPYLRDGPESPYMQFQEAARIASKLNFELRGFYPSAYAPSKTRKRAS